MMLCLASIQMVQEILASMGGGSKFEPECASYAEAAEGWGVMSANLLLVRCRSGVYSFLVRFSWIHSI